MLSDTKQPAGEWPADAAQAGGVATTTAEATPAPIFNKLAGGQAQVGAVNDIDLVLIL